MGWQTRGVRPASIDQAASSCLSVSLSTRRCVYVSNHRSNRSIYLSIYPSTDLPVGLCIEASIDRSACSSIHASKHLSVYRHLIYRSILHPSMHLSTSLSIYPSTRRYSRRGCGRHLPGLVAAARRQNRVRHRRGGRLHRRAAAALLPPLAFTPTRRTAMHARGQARLLIPRRAGGPRGYPSVSTQSTPCEYPEYPV
jgi:hypothetical protein